MVRAVWCSKTVYFQVGIIQLVFVDDGEASAIAGYSPESASNFRTVLEHGHLGV